MRSDLVQLLARHVDFRLPGREALGEYLASVGPAELLARNPSLSSTTVRSLVIAATENDEPDLFTLQILLSMFELDAESRSYLLSTERRANVWALVVRYQSVSDEEVTQMRSVCEGPGLSGVLAFESAQRGFSARDDFTEILEEAGPRAQLRWLEKGGVGSFLGAAPRWIANFSSDHYVLAASDGISSFELLAATRPDLHQVLIAVQHPEALAAVAASRHCVDVDRQLDVIGFARRDAPDNIEEWYKIRGAAAVAMVRNPRCHEAILSELDEWLMHRGVRLYELREAISRRRAEYASHPTVSEPYEDVRNPDVLAWLVDRSAAIMNSKQSLHPFDVGVLLSNTNLTSVQRARLEKTPLPDVLRTQSVNEGSYDGEATIGQARRAWRGGRCTSLLGSCGRARCSSMRTTDFSSLSSESLSSTIDDIEERGPWCQSTPLDEWLVDCLGAEPRTYETFLALATDWCGTLGELVETVITLRQTV